MWADLHSVDISAVTSLANQTGAAIVFGNLPPEHGVII